MAARLGLAFLGAVLISSCATLDRHRAGVGPGDGVAPSPEGLVLEIGSDQTAARISDALQFVATIKNRGEQNVRVPAKPVLLYMWVYPNQQKDHFLVEIPKTCHYQPQQTRILKPGEQMQLTGEIDTKWFPFAGVTEFQAIWNLPENTNPQLDGFPKGPIYSNRFGVRMHVR